MEKETGRFRTKKRNFTQISNYILQDDTVTLKAKGLYAMIEYYLSIPNFTLYKSFLLKKMKEGEATLKSSWKELKDKGYLIQYRIQTQNGFVYEYELLDIPENKKSSPEGDFLPVGNQHMENQPVESPQVENNTIINNKQENNNLKNNNINNQSIKEISDNSDRLIDGNDYLQLIKSNKTDSLDYNDVESFIKKYYKYDDLIESIKIHSPNGASTPEIIDSFIDTILDILLTSSNEKTIKIGNTTYNTSLVKNKLLKLNNFILEELYWQIIDNQTQVKNPVAYMRALLFNAAIGQGVASAYLQ